jgi:hypothetical protein
VVGPFGVGQFGVHGQCGVVGQLGVVVSHNRLGPSV